MATSPATPKQTAFLSKLGYQGDYNLNWRQASALIDQLLRENRSRPAPVVDDGRLASEKQIAFLGTLGISGATGLTAAAASTLISEALAARETAKATRPAITAVGMYRTSDGRIYKVQQSKESRRFYAKELVEISGHRLTESGESATWEFQYAPGAIHGLSADDRMTVEDAKRFGLRYGCCCVCGATLKDQKSVEAGIGPVCARKV